MGSGTQTVFERLPEHVQSPSSVTSSVSIMSIQVPAELVVDLICLFGVALCVLAMIGMYVVYRRI
jgi:hypothetical protein